MVFRPRHLSLGSKGAIPKKMAFLVTGPESSGTKMMVNALCSVGVQWVHKNSHRTDELSFHGMPDKIALHRSVPHSSRMPDFRKIMASMEQSGYTVFPIVMIRDPECTCKSQVKNWHVASPREANRNMANALIHILNSLPEVYAVRYENFANVSNYRKNAFAEFGFPPPTIEFYDGNAKYLEQEC